MIKRLALVGVLLINLFAASIALSPLAADAATLVAVRPSTLAASGWEPWLFDPAPTPTPTITFQSGPGTPPAGQGSVHFAVGAQGGDAAMVRYKNAVGVALADVTTLTYSTYVTTPGNGQQAPYLSIYVDLNNDGNWVSGTDDRLFFEPVYQNGTYPQAIGVTIPNQCGLDLICVNTGEWQTWDAKNGGWRADSIGANQHTLASYAALHPGAKIVNQGALGGVRLGVGGGSPSWDNFVGSADSLTLTAGGTTPVDLQFDFEPLDICYADVTTGDDATKGGTSPGDAKKTIQACINIVGVGGTVIIAAGTYPEQIVIDKDGLTLQGAGRTDTIVDNVADPGTGIGIAISGSRSNITIADLRVTRFQDGIHMLTGPATNILVEDVDIVANSRHGFWSQAFDLTGLTLRRVNASSNGTAGNAGRGLWVINGTKNGITVEDGTFRNNGLVGIDISDGSVTNLAITGNTVEGNGDSGIGVLGAQGPGTTLVSGNTVTNNGRFGIEIKNPNGSGATSGPGSVVVSNNTVSRTSDATRAEDHAGIAVFKRAPDPSHNAAQPTGVVVSGNTVSGYHRMPSGSTGDGIGIVVEGLNQTVQRNTVTGNDVGIQVQAGNTINTQGTPYFDRGDAAASGGAVKSNTITGNAIGVRGVGNVATLVFANAILGNATGLDGSAGAINAENNWWGCNAGPNAAGCDSAIGAGADNNPWLTLRITRAPGDPTASPAANFAIVADLVINSNASDTTAAGTVPDGTAITFAVAPPASGTITSTGGGTVNGAVAATFTAGAAGCPVIAAISDDQTVTTQLCITEPTPSPTPSPSVEPSPSATPAPSPSPTPVPLPSPTTYTVMASVTGGGTVDPVGATQYNAGTVASYAATANEGQVFLGWTLDEQYVGYASTLTLTVSSNRTLVAQFAARPSFNDVPSSDPDYQAVTLLAALGIINPNGVNGSGDFQPGRGVVRAEMASFVARAFGWDTEFHGNGFPDQCDPQGENCVDSELWNNVAALQDYGVVGGYTDAATCTSAGTTAPCYLPRDPVQRVQVLSIVARAFTRTAALSPTGFWDRLPADPAQYTNVPDTGTQRSDLTTYTANAGLVPGAPDDTTFPSPTDAGSRRFVIQALYQAFNAWYGTDRVP